MTGTAATSARATEAARSPTLDLPGRGRHPAPASLNHSEDPAQAPRQSARTATGLSAVESMLSMFSCIMKINRHIKSKVY